MNNNTSIDPRASKFGNIIKVLFLVFSFAFLAPFFWLAIGGLVGFIVFATIGLSAWMLRPFVFTKAANLRLALLKRAVAENPVETLQDEHLRQTKILNESKSGIETMSGAIRTLDQAIDDLQSEFPDSPELPQMREDQAELIKLLENREAEWTQAYITLGEFAKEIKRVEKLWQVSVAAASARKKSSLTEDEWSAQLKTNTAIDTVRLSLNTQLSGLRIDGMQAAADKILKGKSVKATIVNK